MRKLLYDAAEALWSLVTAPLKKLIVDALAEAMIRSGPSLRWPAQPIGDCAMGPEPEPEWLLNFYTELAPPKEPQ